MTGVEAVRGRSCGSCSLCCSVLRVDELEKLGGTSCVHQRLEGGCSIHSTRPAICRAYRCLWLQGSLGDDDRPDRLGAVLDLRTRGSSVCLEIREASPGTYERSSRLQEIASAHRESMPVQISGVSDVMNPDAPFRLLLADGLEQRIAGEKVLTYRNGERVGEQRLPWLERTVRRIRQRVLERKLRGYRGGAEREE